MICKGCKKVMKRPESVHNGMGPICYKKWVKQRGQEPPIKRTFLLPPHPDVVLAKFENKIATNIPHKWVLHSPVGFNWGYGGSGPADLALNILLHYGLSHEDAHRYHQKFKWHFITPMPDEGGVIPGQVVKEWIEDRVYKPKAQETAPPETTPQEQERTAA